MDHSPKERFFTPKEWLLILSLWIFYAVVIFSMDPRWVAWSAPLAFGGALAAAGPPPFPIFNASSQEVFGSAAFLSFLSLATLAFVPLLRGEPIPGLFAGPGRGAEGIGRRSLAHGFQARVRRWKLEARTLLYARRDSSIGEEMWERHPPASAQRRVTTASQRSRVVSGSLGARGRQNF